MLRSPERGHSRNLPYNATNRYRYHEKIHPDSGRTGRSGIVRKSRRNKRKHPPPHCRNLRFVRQLRSTFHRVGPRHGEHERQLFRQRRPLPHQAPETGAVQRRHQPLRNLCGRQGGGHRRSRHRFAQHPEQPHARLRVRPGRVRKYLYGGRPSSNARQWKRSNSFRAATVTATER